MDRTLRRLGVVILALTLLGCSTTRESAVLRPGVLYNLGLATEDDVLQAYVLDTTADGWIHLTLDEHSPRRDWYPKTMWVRQEQVTFVSPLAD